MPELSEEQWNGHHREHDSHEQAHAREHEQTQTALNKAEGQVKEALDKAERNVSDRFKGHEKLIDQLREDAFKNQGKSIGQGAVVAIIVGAIGLVGTILGIVVVLSNFIT